MVRITLCIIGHSNFFKSGLSTYTLNLLDLFSRSHSFHTSALFLNKFIPKQLFPGKNRNPADYHLTVPSTVPFFNGLDWFLFPSLIKSFKFLSSLKTTYHHSFLFQWWTSSVLHIYLFLSYFIKWFYPQSKIILEVHEIFDPLEQRIKPLGWYVRFLFPLLLGKSDFLLFHSRQEILDFSTRFSINPSKIYIVNHILPPQQQLSPSPSILTSNSFTILSFGLIREYKGIPLLIESFNTLMTQFDSHLQNTIHLHIVGEIWDEKDRILSLIKASPFRKNIRLLAKYVPDSSIPEIFSQAQLLVLPYLRGTQSGVAHLGMNYNLPIITTDVGGFAETLSTYDNKVIIPPQDGQALVQAMYNMITSLLSTSYRSQNPSSITNTSQVNQRFVTTLRKLSS